MNMPLVAFSLAGFSGWSDRLGRRKPFIVIALIGRLLLAVAMIFISMEQFIERGYLVLFVSSVIWCTTLLGSHALVMSMCFAYLADITSINQRPKRMLIISMIYLSTHPIGVSLGNFFYEQVFGSSYPAMFALNALFILFSIAWTLWRVNDRQQPEGRRRRAADHQPPEAIGHNVEGKRAHKDKKLLAILLLMLFFYELQHNEKQYSYLYTQRVFGWSDRDFSYFYCFQSSGYFIVAVVLSYFYVSNHLALKHKLGIIIVSEMFQIIADLIYFFVAIDKLFYIAAVIATMGILSVLVIHVMVSILVSPRNTGRIFSFIYFLCDTISPFLGDIVYSNIYYQTVDTLPQAFFIFSTIVQNILLLLSLLLLRNKNDHLFIVNQPTV